MRGCSRGTGGRTQSSLIKPTSVPSAHHSEDKPRCSHSEQAIPVHPEPEERRLKNIHICHQCEPGEHVTPGRPAVGEPPPEDEDHRGMSCFCSPPWPHIGVPLTQPQSYPPTIFLWRIPVLGQLVLPAVFMAMRAGVTETREKQFIKFDASL